MVEGEQEEKRKGRDSKGRKDKKRRAGCIVESGRGKDDGAANLKKEKGMKI